MDIPKYAGQIVIEPVREKTCKLGELVKAIHLDTLHEAVDFGARKGKEVW